MRIAIRPDFGEAHYGLGDAFVDQGKAHEAVSCFRRYLELAKRNSHGAHLLLAKLGVESIPEKAPEAQM